MTATPAPALTDRTGATDEEFAARIAPFEAEPAAVASHLPYMASEGEYGNGQITHRAVLVGDEFYTGCGKRFRDEEPSWATWGVGGPMDPGEWPEITCPRCPQPPAVIVDYADPAAPVAGDRFGIFEPEEREAAVVESVARAIAEAQGVGRTATPLTRRLAAAAVAAYRSTQPRVDVLLDGELRHTLTVTLGDVGDRAAQDGGAEEAVRSVAASQAECDIAEVLHTHPAVTWADALDLAARALAPQAGDGAR